MDIDGLGEEAGDALPRGRADRGRRRHLRAERGAASWTGTSEERASARSRLATSSPRSTPRARDPSSASSTPSACPASATSPRRRWPTTSARSTPCTTADPEQIEEVEGVGPIMAVQIAESLADEPTWELVEKLREKGLRLEQDPSERRASGGPARRQDPRPHRHPARADPRGGRGADQGGGRQGRQLGLEKNRLRRRRREPGLEAGQSGEIRDRDPRRSGAARHARSGVGRAGVGHHPL